MAPQQDRTDGGRWRERLVTLALALTAALAWVVFLTLEGVATPEVGAALLARLETGAGLVAEGGRSARVHLAPLPTLRFAGLRLRDSAGVAEFAAPEVEARLRWAPLLIGRIEIAELTLRRPRLAFAAGDDAIAALARQGLLARLATAQRLIVEQGEARRRGGEAVEAVDLDLRWRGGGSPLALAAQATWRGERIDLAAWIARPTAITTDGESAARLQARAGVGEIAFEGLVGGDHGQSLSGRVIASGPSLRRLLDFARFEAALPDPGGAFELRAQASSRGQSVSFSDVELQLGPNRFEGSLSLRREDGRPSIAGTLATAALDLGPWLDIAPRLVEANDRWSATPIDWRREEQGNLDLRVSAQRVQAGRIALGETALSLLMKRGRLSVAPARAGLEVKGSLQWSELDIGALLAALQKRPRLSGVATGQLVFETSGAAPADLSAMLDGRAQLTLRNGEIARLDLEQALRRNDRRGAALIAGVQTGRTGFDSLTTTLRATRGVATLDEALMKGPGVTAHARGALQLADQSLSVRVDAAQSGALAQPLRMSFYLAGPWSGPRILPEPDPPRPPPAR
ncbi:MAG: AsmA family protein [Methylobacteriaceae bacterium]|nr:AsmA family protein [Methylobacteriaceae bacterium]